MASEPRLTEREAEVLKLIVAGLTSKQIAASLGIAFKTAACHRERIMHKLDIHETAGFVRYAMANGHDSTSDGESVQRERDRLFTLVREARGRLKKAARDYDGFLRMRSDIGVASPDGTTGLRTRRQAEALAQEDYTVALRRLRDFLLPK